MEENVLIVKYGEIATRGNNRKLFVTRLVDAIRKNLNPYGKYYVVREQGRLIVEDMGGQMDFDLVIPKVICVLGIIGVCPGIKTTVQEMDNLRQICLKHAKEVIGDKNISFKVETKRSDKRFPLESREVSADIGGFILEHTENLRVDVKNPEITLFIELRNDAYIYSKIIKGYGGLPVGSSGKSLCLLSGGIDSPVAAWLMAKRGVEVSGVYFSSPPYTSERAKEKVCDLGKVISNFTGGFKLYVVPFTNLQLYLLENVPHDKLTIFLKRSMMRIAESIAEKNKDQALVTGDSIGQVASQTMQAINAISSSCKIPIIRPLAGNDKQEIIDIAKKIGTFDISIRPYEDCCTIFVAKHPETKPKTSVIEKIEKNLDRLDELLNECLENIEIIDL